MKLGFKMILDLSIPEQAAAYQMGRYETHDMKTCLEILPSDGVFLDIGANIGMFSCAVGVHFKKKASQGRIYSFEPVPTTYNRLLQNLNLNDLCTVVNPNNIALSDACGSIMMYQAPAGNTTNAVSEYVVSNDLKNSMQLNNWAPYEATALTLDQWSKKTVLKKCDLIKIDVEGAEMKVLKGAYNFINQFRPIILGEFNPYWMGQCKCDIHDVINYFDNVDYQVYLKLKNKYIKMLKTSKLPDIEIPTYLILPREKESLHQYYLRRGQ